MSRVRTRLEQYKAEIEKKSQYKHGLPGSALDIANTLLNDLKQNEKEKDWIIVKYHKITDAERKENCYSEDIEYYLDGSLPDDGQEIIVTDGENTWCDICSVNSDVEYGLESCIDWIEIKAWMPLPEPYKEG